MVADSTNNIRGPDSGCVLIELHMSPVRTKASRKRKDIITRAMRRVTSRYRYILTGEVAVDVEWMIHERERYESHRSPDLDNILKTILDGLQGPEGIIVDDAQVQSISCRWVDWRRGDQRLSIRISHIPDEYCDKRDLIFVRMANSLCMPLNMDLPAEGLLLVLEEWEAMFHRNKVLRRRKKVDYYTALRVLPVQRAFHSSRVRRFPLRTLHQLRNELQQSATATSGVR